MARMNKDDRTRIGRMKSLLKNLRANRNGHLTPNQRDQFTNLFEESLNSENNRTIETAQRMRQMIGG